MSDDEITPGSIQAYVTSQIRKGLSTETQKIAVPKFGGRLILKCQAVDARTAIRMSIEAQQDPDEVEGLINKPALNRDPLRRRRPFAL